jgi:hypothetical protein
MRTDYRNLRVLQLSSSLISFDAKYEENTSLIMCWGRERNKEQRALNKKFLRYS